MMRIDLSILRRWIDILVRLLFNVRDWQRARRCLKVGQEGDRLTIRQVKGKEEVALGTVAAGATLPIEIARASRRAFVVFTFPADEIICRQMTVPAQARDLLPGIVRNQIERLSAWRPQQAAFGFDARAGTDATSLDVRVFIASRALLDEACERLGKLGLRVDRVVAEQRAGERDAPVTLWSRVADAPDRGVARARLVVGGILAATVCVAMAVSLWAFMSAAAADDESEQVAARLATLQRQAQGGRSQRSIAALAPPERVWALKQTSPVAVVVLEALSRALPDTSFLTDLNLDGSTLRIVGLADDAPSLIAPLEKSGHLEDVHFFAPSTRGADGRRFVFHIEARVEPHPKIDGG